jgi:hypothetical protein
LKVLESFDTHLPRWLPLHMALACVKLCLLWVFVAGLLAGCGGFSEQDSSATGSGGAGSTQVFLSGAVAFPSAALASVQKISKNSRRNRSISKALSKIGVGNARIALYRVTDLNFEHDLIKSGEIIITNPSGNFVVTVSQITAESFSTTETAWVLRARFQDFELGSLISVKDANSPLTEAVEINPSSDGVLRFLNEEVARKSGGTTREAELLLLPWKNSFKSLALDLAQRRSEIQKEFEVEDFQADNYKITTTLENRIAGREWSQKIDNLALNQRVWEQILTRREDLKLGAISNRNETGLSIPEQLVQARRRKLQLLFASLEFGFFISSGQGSVWVKDRWQELESSLAPSFGTTLTTSTLKTFEPSLTDEDLALLPAPPGLIEFTPSELSSFRSQGPGAEERSELILQDIDRFPWISWASLQALSTLTSTQLGSLISFEKVLDIAAKTLILRRHSIERVQRTLSSGGLIFYGEDVPVIEEFGGVHPTDTLWESFYRTLNLDSDFESNLLVFLRQEPIFLPLLQPAYRSAYGRLLRQSFTLNSQNSGYPDPLSRTATRNLIFRVVGGERKYDSKRLERYVEFLVKVFRSLHGLSNSGTGLDLTQKRPLASLFPFIASLPFVGFQLDSSIALFQTTGQDITLTVPRVENLGFSRFPPEQSEFFWEQILLDSNAGVVWVTDASLPGLAASLRSIQGTTIPHLTVDRSGESSVVAQGNLFLARQLGAVVPAVGFLIDAVPASSAVSAPTTYTAQSDSAGRYTFSASPIPGDQLYNFRVLVKDSLLSSSPTTALTFLYYIAGFEGEVQLPDFYMESQFALRATSYGGNLAEIQPANLGPVITLEPIPSVTSAIIPLRILISDPESNPVGLEFSFTSGLAFSVTTANPRISISSQVTGATTFAIGGVLGSFPASPSGTLTVLYWHSLLEQGLDSQGTQDNIQVSLQVFEADSPVIRGNQVQSIFFDLDNLPPVLSFDPPLKDGQDSNAIDFSEQTGELITLTGNATDRSAITGIEVQNLSLSSGKNQTFVAEDIGNSFGSWRITDLAVETGIENILSFKATDEHGNMNSLPVSASFISQDVLPPEIQITSLRFDSDRNIPVLSSLDAKRSVSVTSTVSPDSVVLSVSTTSLALSIDTVTTNRLIVDGTVRDISGISSLKLGSVALDTTATDGIHFVWSQAITLAEGLNKTLVFSALDKKGNESENSVLQLSITTVDFSAPAIALTSPSSSRDPKTVSSTVVVLSGAATDFSRITSFQLCSALGCANVSSTDGFWNWSVSLEISEAQSNPITGFISDEFGFQDDFTIKSPFISLRLNDITSPTFVLTSILSGVVLSPPLLVDESFSEILPRTNPVPITLAVTQCIASSCSISLLGRIQDGSGFTLVPDATGNFSDFLLRVSHRGFGTRVFDPSEAGEVAEDLLGATDGSDFNNDTNTSRITTSSVAGFINASGVQTTVPFQVEFNLKDDGLWPVTMRLKDGAQDLFGFFTRPELFRRELIYLKKDQGAPVISGLSLGGNDPATGNRVIVSGRVDDELSPITSVTVNEISTSVFSILPASSPWNQFITLESGVSVGFQVQITLAAGSSKVISVSAKDSFGNLGQITTSITVFPLFSAEIQGSSQFHEPIALSFGGPFLDNIFVADMGRLRVESLAANGVVLTTITGNQKAGFFDALDRLQSFDYFQDRFNADPEAMVLDGVFKNGTQTVGVHEVVRLEKEADGQYNTSETSLSQSDDHVFRNQLSSTQANPIATRSLVRFTPLLGSVIYLYQATSSAGEDQLFRYVKSVINEPSFQARNASDGGLPDSTGVLGAGVSSFELSSQVATIVITQAHILDSNGAEGVSTSFETVHLLDAGLQRIARFLFSNQAPASGGGFLSLPAISLTSIALSTGSTNFISLVPTAMDIEPDGQTAYVANQTDGKIYKLDITSSTAILTTSFGGLGLSDSKFQSIDFIRGFQPLNENSFSLLFVVDRTSARISKFGTDGSFIDYFGVNPLGKGGMERPLLLAESGSQWVLLDEALQSLDFFNASDNVASVRLDPASLGLSSFSTSKNLLIAPLTGFQDLNNYLDSNYETQGAELFKTTTQEYFYLQSNSLHHSVTSQAEFFTATGTGSSRFRIENAVVNGVQHTEHSQARSSFNNLVDMALVEDGQTLRIYTLEQNPDDDAKDRVQAFYFSNQSPSESLSALPSTKNLAQTSSVGICEVGSGVMVVGNLPSDQVDFARFISGTRKFSNDWSFESPSIFGFLGEALSLNQPGSIDCSSDRLVVADGNTVKIFEVPSDMNPGITLIQEIQTADPSLPSTDALRILSGPLEVLLQGSSLYVLERSRVRVLKYQIK